MAFGEQIKHSNRDGSPGSLERLVRRRRDIICAHEKGWLSPESVNRSSHHRQSTLRSQSSIELTEAIRNPNRKPLRVQPNCQHAPTTHNDKSSATGLNDNDLWRANQTSEQNGPGLFAGAPG